MRGGQAGSHLFGVVEVEVFAGRVTEPDFGAVTAGCVHRFPERLLFAGGIGTGSAEGGNQVLALDHGVAGIHADVGERVGGIERPLPDGPALRDQLSRHRRCDAKGPRQLPLPD